MRNILVEEHIGGLTPGVAPKPPHAREHRTDEKRHPHAELEEHHIGVAWSRCSKQFFVHCIASVRTAAFGPLISRLRIRAERAALRVPPRKTCRRAYLFPVPCEFFAAIAIAPWCIAVARATERKRRQA
jgi:hypothetical protein